MASLILFATAVVSETPVKSTLTETLEKLGPDSSNFAIPVSAKWLLPSETMEATLVRDPALMSVPTVLATWNVELRRPSPLVSTTELDRSSVTSPFAVLAAPPAVWPPPMNTDRALAK